MPPRRAEKGDKSRTEAIPTTVDPAETDACFIVRDANRQALAYVYFEKSRDDDAAAKLLTRDEARRIPEIAARPPELVEADAWRACGFGSSAKASQSGVR